MLQQVLLGFSGTILFVSHDRYLVNALATHIWRIEQGSMRQYEGNYTAYLQQLAEEQSTNEAPATAPAVKDTWVEQKRRERQGERLQRERRERVLFLEGEIDRLEREIELINLALGQASQAQDFGRVQSLSGQYARLQDELAACLHSWEQAAGSEG